MLKIWTFCVRDELKGMEAVDKINMEEGLGIKFHQLDVGDEGSIKNVADFVKKKLRITTHKQSKF